LKVTIGDDEGQFTPVTSTELPMGHQIGRHRTIDFPGFPHLHRWLDSAKISL
jgi:hypothetical protein